MSLGETEGHSLGCLLSDAHMSHVIKFVFFPITAFCRHFSSQSQETESNEITVLAFLK